MKKIINKTQLLNPMYLVAGAAILTIGFQNCSSAGSKKDMLSKDTAPVNNPKVEDAPSVKAENTPKSGVSRERTTSAAFGDMIYSAEGEVRKTHRSLNETIHKENNRQIANTEETEKVSSSNVDIIIKDKKYKNEK